MGQTTHAASPASRRLTIVSSTVGAITAAVTKVQTGLIVTGLEDAKYLIVQANFVYGSGGTTAAAYVQTSLDAGVSWIDIMAFNFTTASAVKVSAVVTTTALAAAVTPGSGALTANTILSGLLGDRVQVLFTTTGTYGGNTSLALDMVAKG